MTLEQELRTVWEKYAPQRDAEANAARSQAQANKDLGELNARRKLAGLDPVGTYQGMGQMGSLGQVYPPPRTWRDDMDDELLSTVKEWLAQ